MSTRKLQCEWITSFVIWSRSCWLVCRMIVCLRYAMLIDRLTDIRRNRTRAEITWRKPCIIGQRVYGERLSRAQRTRSITYSHELTQYMQIKYTTHTAIETANEIAAICRPRSACASLSNPTERKPHQLIRKLNNKSIRSRRSNLGPGICMNNSVVLALSRKKVARSNVEGADPVSCVRTDQCGDMNFSLVGWPTHIYYNTRDANGC